MHIYAYSGYHIQTIEQDLESLGFSFCLYCARDDVVCVSDVLIVVFYIYLFEHLNPVTSPFYLVVEVLTSGGPDDVVV